MRLPFPHHLRPARLLSLALLPAFVGLGLALADNPPGSPSDSPHLRMGNPSDATTDPLDRQNYLMDKAFFVLSYNNQHGTPNWVSWRLSADDIGDAPRRPFHPDPALPDGFRRIVPHDYTNSGFDRGHMCPHDDRSRTPEASLSTFVMTNMVPQSPQNNQQAWAQLEEYLRDLVRNQHKICYIVAGPHGRGGVGRDGLRSTTNNASVVVPSHTWKVVMILDHDVPSARDLTPQTPIRLLGVVIPNDNRVGPSWAEFRAPVSEIENLTGLHFFSRVDPNLIDPLKLRPDTTPIP